MSLKSQMTPDISKKIHMTFVLVHVIRRKKLKTVRGSYLPFVIKHALFPLKTTNLLVSCSSLFGMCVQTFVKYANFYTTSSWWHDITSTKVSCVSGHFLFFFELKWHVTPCIRMHVSVSWDQFVWKFLLIYYTWN